MKKWIAVAAVVAGLGIFGGAAVAQEDGAQEPNQPPAQSQQQEQNRDGQKPGCGDRREGQDTGGENEV